MPQLNPAENITFNINERLRALEGKYTSLGEYLLVINQNMLKEHKRLSDDIRRALSELNEIKEDITRLKEKTDKIIEEMALFARKEQIKILEKYINMWDPLKFVTTEEVGKIIEETLKKVKHGKKRR